MQLNTKHSPTNKALNIFIIGAGGLGTPAAWSLISDWPLNGPPLRLTIVDGDKIELSNLNRQVLFTEENLGSQKASSLANALREIIPENARADIIIESVCEHLESTNIEILLKSADLVIECTDSVISKFLINDYCVRHKIPYCYGGVISENGLVLAVDPRGSYPSKTDSQATYQCACLRCIFNNFSDGELDQFGATCQQAGIIGAVAGVVGAIQAQQSLLLLFSEPPSQPALIRVSMSNELIKSLAVQADPDCPLGCGQKVCVKNETRELNLSDKKCPETFLYTKLALETLQTESKLEVRFGSEESVKNVAVSVAEEGHLVLEQKKLNSGEWTLLIQAK